MDWYNLLKSRKRSSRTFFDHIIRMWRRLRRTMVFSLVLVVLSILPQGYLLVSIATAFARASALTLFTGFPVAAASSVISFFWPGTTAILYRFLNIWKTAYFVNADVLDPFFSRHFDVRTEGAFKRMVLFQQKNMDLILPFTTLWMIISGVPLFGPLLFLFSVPCSALLVPYLVDVPGGGPPGDLKVIS
eukprot:GHVR01026992.1.p1 GENE.GHVR01026992.1~~GHVR01026992.1.p1  ORF type:complete len:189 (+),score=0.25 GHVR01026992.1:725-1291(+)